MRLPSLGEDFGRYRLERELGRGGMGIVYAARDTSLDRLVALKLITPQWAEDPEYRARFEREALSLSRVESAHVVAVHDYGELDGCLYLVTQVVPDGDLLQLVRREGALAPAVALDIAGQILAGLSDAHAVGVVHRDVKPSNVLLRRRDGRLEAVLCDFGIATSPGGDVTRTGALVGSFPYMAPERHQGEQADGAADVYSAGCVLWQLLTGTAPYVGSDVEVAMAHLQAPLPQLPETDGFSRALNLVLARALAKDPAERYPSARAMRTDLLSVTSLAPERLDLPDVTSIRHVLVPGVIAAQAGTGAAEVGAPARKQRPVVAVLAASVAVVLAVVGTYALVGLGSGGPDEVTSGDASAVGGLGALLVSPSSEATSTSGSDAGVGPQKSKKPGSSSTKRPQGSNATVPSQDGAVVPDPGAAPGSGTSGSGTSGSGGPGSSGGPGTSGSGTSGNGSQDSGPKGGPKGTGGAKSTPTATPTPTPAPKTFRCWDGVETYGYNECAALSGVSGVQWVWQNNSGCTQSSTAGGGRLVILTCPRGNAEVTYTLWKSVDAALDYFTNTKFGERGDNWRSGWGYTWYKSTPSSTYKLNRVQLYSQEPVSVTVAGKDQTAQDKALASLQPYREPSQLRGVPIG